MSEQSEQPRRFLPLPAEFELDALTQYIYRHFKSLLTDEERATERVRTGRVKQLCSSEPEGTTALEFFGVPEMQGAFPELIRRIDEKGISLVMRDAAERVLRDNPDKAILHSCAKCGTLCRTPVAQQCFECGFDWHSVNG